MDKKSISTASKLFAKAKKENDISKKTDGIKKAAELFRKGGDFRLALDCGREILSVLKHGGDPFEIAWIYRNMALDCYHMNDYDGAILYSKKAVENFSKANAFYAIKWCYNDIAMIYEERGDIIAAIKY
ncbi:MAG: tetratricopeptide repeat protein, partial [Candidatus Micrarchaeota archaeon]|nr:tetratricopeptide repeat protein [Candidatus Micrarchaeota archaeon]